MSFEEVLANCLAALEQGQSPQECLAQYPAYQAELAPILHTIVAMRSGPKPQLSSRAFARGRAAVAAHARHHQKLHQPFLAASPRAVQTHPFYAPPPSAAGVKAAQVKPAPVPTPARGFLYIHGLTRALIVLLLIVTFASFVRGVAASLPGSLLYPIKGWGENAQGLLMLASGQEASWHINQLKRRLTEVALLSQQGITPNPALTVAIDDHLQAALDASAAMAPDQRQQFLATWLAGLYTLQQDLPAEATTVATLAHTIATVEAAAQSEQTPTILPSETTPTAVPQATLTDTATAVPQVLLPTVTPTDTDTPTPLATATATPTAGEMPTLLATEATGAQPLDLATPTATVAIPVGAPTVTQSPQLMPEERNQAAEPDNSADHHSSATPTPQATSTASAVGTVPPPRIPLPSPVESTVTAAPTAAETPAEANITPVPGGIPTSAEPSTPVPTTDANGTPAGSSPKPTEVNGGEKTATPAPTKADNKTNTPEATKPPEPTATEKGATATPARSENKGNTPEATNTPKPEETAAPPDDEPGDGEEAATPDPDDEQPTPEPTATPKKKKK